MMKSNGSKVVRINSEIAKGIEHLAAFFEISTSEASVIFFTISYINSNPLRNVMKQAKIRYVKRRVLQKVQKTIVKL